jgi:hypothetical protein
LPGPDQVSGGAAELPTRAVPLGLSFDGDVPVRRQEHRLLRKIRWPDATLTSDNTHVATIE